MSSVIARWQLTEDTMNWQSLKVRFNALKRSLKIMHWRSTMVSAKSMEIVKQTVPVLQEHGETLTCHFYRRMFEGNPEVKAFFNPAHQHSGDQQRALAGAICAYAQHVDNPAALADAVELIAHKHASLMVKSEHYPIVGKHLLSSIREVLGDAATDEVIEAWAEAYGAIAEILINREATLYQKQEASHGWTGFRPFTVRRKQPESEVITSFYLEPASGTEIIPHQPGQYLTVRTPAPEATSKDGTTMRNYSISSAPGADHYRISVKREGGAGAPEGHVSNHLHQHVKEGDQIEVGPPCGSFVLQADEPAERPLVFISGGVGITPCLSMLHAALQRQPERKVFFIHGALNAARHAFGREIHDLESTYTNLTAHIRYSAPEPGDDARCNSIGLVDADLITSLVPTNDASFYFCGPKPLMLLVNTALREWGVEEKNMHHEFFGPAQALQG